MLTLYEMLDRAMAHQKVWIYENNAYDQNMPLFKGTVNDARIEPELRVWDFLMCEVEFYDCSNGILFLFDNDQIVKAWEEADKLSQEVNEGRINLNDLVSVLEDEYHVILRR